MVRLRTVAIVWVLDWLHVTRKGTCRKLAGSRVPDVPSGVHRLIADRSS